MRASSSSNLVTKVREFGASQRKDTTRPAWRELTSIQLLSLSGMSLYEELGACASPHLEQQLMQLSTWISWISWTLKTLFLDGDDEPIFQHDLAPVEKGKKTQEFLQQHTSPWMAIQLARLEHYRVYVAGNEKASPRGAGALSYAFIQRVLLDDANFCSVCTCLRVLHL